MYLKAGLVGTVSVEELTKRKYSHNIVNLWDAFKGKERTSALDRFDSTIAALHHFESIRYPDKLVSKGMLGAVIWRSSDVRPIGGSTGGPPAYWFVIAEVDELLIEVLDRSNLNPGALVRFGALPGMRDALVYQNPHAARWI